MSSLKSFDPTAYLIRDETVCGALKNKDTIHANELAEKFKKVLLQKDDEPHHGIFAILAPTGEGKTFFLSLLYCQLNKKRGRDQNKNIHYDVSYIDTFDYALGDGLDALSDRVTDMCSKQKKTTIILFDNLEKHSPNFIVDFIYRIDRLTREENLLCVLAYDDQVIESKLKSMFDAGEATQQFFQSYIDIEFYLMPSPEKIQQITGSQNILAEEISNEYGYIQESINSVLTIFGKYLSLSQIRAVIKKLRFFFEKEVDKAKSKKKNNEDQKSNDSEKKGILGTNEIAEFYRRMLIVLMIMKLKDKKMYRDFFDDRTITYDDIIKHPGFKFIVQFHR